LHLEGRPLIAVFAATRPCWFARAKRRRRFSSTVFEAIVRQRLRSSDRNQARCLIYGYGLISHCRFTLRCSPRGRADQALPISQAATFAERKATFARRTSERRHSDRSPRKTGPGHYTNTHSQYVADELAHAPFFSALATRGLVYIFTVLCQGQFLGHARGFLANSEIGGGRGDEDGFRPPIPPPT
jgi:hypothetical protein